MTRDEYTAKSNNEKELLVLKFYKEMVKGKIWYVMGFSAWVSILAWILTVPRQLTGK